MAIYKFKYSSIQTTVEFPSAVVEYLGGKAPQKEKKQHFLSQYGLNPLSRYIINFYDYYYLEGAGYVHKDAWREVLGDRFCNFEITITQWCVENNVSRRFDRWLKNNCPSYLEHTKDLRYRALIGKLTRGGSDYGRIINTRKEGANYPGGAYEGRLLKSYNKALQILKSNNVTPEFNFNEWKGVCCAEGPSRRKDFYYKVRCNNCGNVYSTRIGPTIVVRCPNCVGRKYVSSREAELASYLKEKGIAVIRSLRTLIHSTEGRAFELDLYLPDYRIAVELNGYWFHSVNGKYAKSVDYHQQKRLACEREGVRLFIFWEDDSMGLIKSILMKAIGKVPQIPCDGKVIEGEFSEFVERNSPKFYVPNLKYKALVKDSKILAVIAYKEFSAVDVYRYAEVRDKVVSGALSCLLAGFKGDVNLYKDADFEEVKGTTESYIISLRTVKRVIIDNEVYETNRMVYKEPDELDYLKIAADSGLSLEEAKDAIIKCYNSGLFKEQVRLQSDVVSKFFTRLNKEIPCKLLKGNIIKLIGYSIAVRIIVFRECSQGRFEQLKYEKVLESKGFRLIQIYESEIRDHEDVVLSLIKSKCRLLSRKAVGARKVKLVDIEDNKIAEEFLDKTHIQGYGQGIYKALVHEGKIVSIMGVKRGPSNTSSKGAWELNRYASVSDVFVIGGFEKLMKSFQDEYDIHHWISYADKRVSSGDLYEHEGWKMTNVSNPDYRYVYRGEIRHKFNFRIKNFMENPELEYRKGMSETQLAELNGLIRVYDCGKLKYEKLV